METKNSIKEKMIMANRLSKESRKILDSISPEVRAEMGIFYTIAKDNILSGTLDEEVIDYGIIQYMESNGVFEKLFIKDGEPREVTNIEIRSPYEAHVFQKISDNLYLDGNINSDNGFPEVGISINDSECYRMDVAYTTASDVTLKTLLFEDVSSDEPTQQNIIYIDDVVNALKGE